MILNTHWTSRTTMHLFTDASGKEVWGAYWSDRWLQGHWSSNQESMDITWKELYAISNSCSHMGILLAMSKNPFSL